MRRSPSASTLPSLSEPSSVDPTHLVECPPSALVTQPLRVPASLRPQLPGPCPQAPLGLISETTYLLLIPKPVDDSQTWDTLDGPQEPRRLAPSNASLPAVSVAGVSVHAAQRWSEESVLLLVAPPPLHRCCLASSRCTNDRFTSTASPEPSPCPSPSQLPINIVLQERTCPVRAELRSDPGSQPGLWEKPDPLRSGFV
ncbi:hypothetical protein J1605_004309 [Eschrichtius robustus]|uniref:Uncharacterized protein n=1 Tax=Eschrichtius robustus TaxID=9764 RepID=A0AB34HJQ5_ESCRO|nr:hypothetical protein J1605_004309 [Eschrichtius robustus]